MANERPLIVETGNRSSGGAGWVIAAVLVVLAVVGFFLFGPMMTSETAKDNAVANAANSVGEAARDVGNAAQDAVKK